MVVVVDVFGRDAVDVRWVLVALPLFGDVVVFDKTTDGDVLELCETESPFYTNNKIIMKKNLIQSFMD